ncbi:hypothetical protein OUZ56_011714 [Daphnia magna]|uniref:Uncharacterized protein n=1 Tax=Daphnia magna TaxID=35525 RepID=A0ABQ9Z132_9CRUS|nr:hypothetical protein OUZ56_011714 [Daphnia magna]
MAGRARPAGKAETNNKFETTARGQASSTTSINVQRCALFHWFKKVHVTFAAWKKVDYLKRVRTAAG